MHKPGYATPESTATPDVCARCGGPVRGSDGDGFWMIDGAPHHAGCAPWSHREFPYGWAIALGRRATRRLRRAGVDDRRLAAAVAWLEAVARRWPTDDPVRTLRTARRAVALVEARAREPGGADGAR